MNGLHAAVLAGLLALTAVPAIAADDYVNQATTDCPGLVALPPAQVGWAASFVLETTDPNCSVSDSVMATAGESEGEDVLECFPL